MLDLGLERSAVVAFGFVNGVHTLAKIGELLTQGVEQPFDLSFVVLGELGGFFFEEFGGDSLELGLEGGFEFLGVGEVAGGEGFALGETRFGRLQTLGTRGAFSREIRSGGGETGGELGAGLFEFVVRSGEAGELFIPRADPFQHCGLAVVLDQPSNDSGEQGSGEGDESKNHVKLGGRSLNYWEYHSDLHRSNHFHVRQQG